MKTAAKPKPFDWSWLDADKRLKAEPPEWRFVPLRPKIDDQSFISTLGEALRPLFTGR